MRCALPAVMVSGQWLLGRTLALVAVVVLDEVPLSAADMLPPTPGPPGLSLTPPPPPPGVPAAQGVVAALKDAAEGDPKEAVEGEEEEEEEKHISAVDAGVSVMLLGGICFVMVLYELTNCYKETVKKNTWLVLSSTISIFSAVLIFQGVHGLLESYVVHEVNSLTDHILIYAHFLIWFSLLQILLAVICGVIVLPESLFDPHHENPEHMEKRVKTFGILLGHIAGFASIMAFCQVQQHFKANPWIVLAIAPISWACVRLLGLVTDYIRETVSVMGDGKKDAHECLWDEVTEETEDDIIGLTVSFCFVIGMRYFISGVLPNEEGEEPMNEECCHSNWQSFLLLAVGLVTVGMEAVRLLMTSEVKESRLAEQAKNITGMTFSWAIFYSMDWYLAKNSFHHQEGMMKSVVLALSVTMVALVMIFALILAEESSYSSEKVDGIIRAIINAIGILIGFAWEKAFDVAVVDLSESEEVPFFGSIDPPITKLLLGIVLVGVVAPSWYRHIYPTILRYEQKEREEEERERHHKRNAVTDTSELSSEEEACNPSKA